MKTRQWQKRRVGEGKYGVWLDGQRIPGLILGGKRKWVIQLRGKQIQGSFKTANDASEWLVYVEMIRKD